MNQLYHHLVDEVENATIFVEFGAEGQKQKPQSKYTNAGRYKIPKHAKNHAPNQAASRAPEETLEVLGPKKC